MKPSSHYRRNLRFFRRKPRIGPIYSKQLGIMLDADTYTALTLLKTLRRTTYSELIRSYIEWGLENDDLRNKA